SCQAALAQAPQKAEALLLLGELRADRGQFTEAQGLFERALEADRKFAPAFCSIASHRRMTRDDQLWLQGARELVRQQLPLDQQIQLHYALGKFYDDTGEYDEAFNNHRQANELTKQYGGSYDGAGLTALIERIAQRCDAAFARSVRSAANDSERPVFIVGMPRSGTSLTEQILASHPAVFGAGEVRFWDQAFTTLEQTALRKEDLGECLRGLAGGDLKRGRERAGSAGGTSEQMRANI